MNIVYWRYMQLAYYKTKHILYSSAWVNFFSLAYKYSVTEIFRAFTIGSNFDLNCFVAFLQSALAWLKVK